MEAHIRLLIAVQRLVLCTAVEMKQNVSLRVDPSIMSHYVIMGLE